MRMCKKGWVCLLLLCALLLAACAVPEPEPEYENPIRLYYCTQRPEEEKHTRAEALGYTVVDLKENDRPIEEILNKYLQGPEDPALDSPFPDGVVCEKAWMEDNGILMLQLSDAYAQLSGVRLSLANACLTMTLEQFDFVNGIRIETAAGLLSPQTQSPFDANDFLLIDTAVLYPETALSLYFADPLQMRLYPQRQTVSYTHVEELPAMALKALLNGPTEERLVGCIPEGTTLIDVTLDDGLCTVVLSDEFAQCDTAEQRAALAVQSIVCTLCAIDGVEQVELSTLGGARLEYYPIDAPLKADAAWIAD